MKTMKMNKEINKNRVGIYAQKSAEVTAVGDGLASKEVKSPVTETKNFKTDEINKSKTSKISEKDTKKEQKQENQEEEHEELEKQQKQDKNMSSASEFEDVKSNNSSQTNLVRGRERDKLNKAIELQVFPHCEEFYGKEKWNKALETLQKLGYVNWEINTMFRALDRYPKKGLKRKLIENEPDQKDMTKNPHIVDSDSTEKVNIKSGVISGILLDLRANIGDASHPNFHILPENRTKFYLEFYKFLRQEECFQDDPVLCSYFVNQTLMIECRNAQILDQIDKKISKLNRLWPGADFKLIRRSPKRKNIRICIPYSYSNMSEVLEIIKKQNRLPVEEWKVNNTEKWEDGICLDVEVDGGTYLRLIQDQDDIFFLMKKATIKLPVKDEL